MLFPAFLQDVTRAYASLGGLPAPLAGEFLRGVRLLAAGPRDLLVEAGTRAAALPLIAHGSLRVSRPLASGQDVPLYRVGPGDLCALTVRGLLTGLPYGVRAHAVEETRGVLVPPSLFHALLDLHAPFRRQVLTAIASRADDLAALVEEIAAGRLDERLARLLLERGPVVRATHQALADELGTAREVVSRILEAFETRGAVRLQRGRIDVLDGARFSRPPRPQRATPAQLAG